MLKINLFCLLVVCDADAVLSVHAALSASCCWVIIPLSDTRLSFCMHSNKNETVRELG